MECKSKYFVILAICITLCWAIPALADVHYVDAARPDDSGDGLSWATAEQTVAAAIAASTGGDEIWVKSGTYNECITLKSGVGLYGGFIGTESTRSESDWENNITTLDGGQVGDSVTITSGSSSETVLAGFNLINSGLGSYDTVVCASGSSPVIRNSIVRDGNIGIHCTESQAHIENNQFFYNGSGVVCHASSAVITNNLFAYNDMAAIRCQSGDTSRIVNNTLYGNLSGVNTDEAIPIVSNNVVAYGTYGINSSSGESATLIHNCVYGNSTSNYYPTNTAHATDINVDPLFAGGTTGNYHLTLSSPCIDAGEDDEVETGWTDLDGGDRQIDILSISGELVDMGAYEYVDTSVPSTPTVTDDGQMAACLTQIHASWSATDAESGISGYQYAIGTSAGGTDVVGWTTPTPATATEVTHTGLSLVAGPTYYVSVKAANGEGLISSAGTSNGIVAATGLKNGNFEEGFPSDNEVVADYWNSFEESSSTAFDDERTDYHSASYSQKLTINSSGVGGVYQVVTNLAVGQNYTASVWVKGNNTNISFYVGINPYGCTDPASSSTVWSTATSSTQWTNIAITATALTNAATVFIKVVNASTSETAYIDDAAFIRDSITPWNTNNSGYAYRREVTLNACNSARSNVPLFVRIPAPDGMHVDTTSVAVDEITSGSVVSLDPLYTDIWAQCTGKVAEVYFTAGGTTAAGSQRRFLVYYNATIYPTAYNELNPSWGSYSGVDCESPTGIDRFRLTTFDAMSSEVLRFERSRYETGSGYIGELKWGRRPGYSLIQRSGSWSPVEGFRTGYTATSGELVANCVLPEDLVVPTWLSDSSDCQLSLSFSFSNVTPSSPTGFPSHSAEETYRLIKDKPWCEFVMTASDDVELIGNTWDPKILYFNNTQCGFDRMVSDEYNDQALSYIYNNNVSWVVLYNSSDETKAAGWYMFKPGNLCARENTGIEIFNAYKYNIEEDNTYRYLWVFGDNRDDIVALFESMSSGWTVGDSAKYITIVQPTADTVFLPGDSIPIDVLAPSDLDITAKWNRPTLSDLSINLVTTEDGRLEASYVVGSDEDWGTWTLEVYDGQTLVASKNIQVLQGTAHPHVLFTSSELYGIQARRTTTHVAMWNSLTSCCNNILSYSSAPVKIPASGADIRSYGDRLLALALAVKVDPTLSSYKTKMWEYFWTILRYPNWYADGDLWENNNNDLCGMVFLQALAITYDWYYDELTTTERQEVRRCLLQYTERALADFWRQFDQYDMEYSLNNHIWIVHSGLASVVYALKDEMDPTTRAEWDDKCEDAWDRIVSVLSEDGSSPEGVGYDCYGMEYLNRWVEMRRIATSNNGFQDDPWFANTSRWLLYSVLPGGTDNCSGFSPFGDSTPGAWFLPKGIASLLARSMQDPVAQWLAADLVQPVTYNTPLQYLWYDATVTPVVLTTLPNWNYSHDNNMHSGVYYSGGIFVWRSSWDNNAKYFSLKCGRTLVSHAHPDAGNFILHRDGVPYIVDYGYTYKKMTDDHNVLLLDYSGTAVGQYGEGCMFFGVENEPQPGSEYWGSITHVLANGASENPGAFFDLVCNPAPSYDTSESHLSAWTRECVGLGDFFLVRDVMTAELGYEPEFRLLLHSFVSVPDEYLNNPNTAFTYDQTSNRTTNPWDGVSGGWSANPRKNLSNAAHTLYVDELSFDVNWSSTIGVSGYVPTSAPTGDPISSGSAEYQFGGMLTRSIEANSTSSLIGLRFDDETNGWTLKRWNDTQDGGDSQAEGVVARNSQSQTILMACWPVGGSCTSSRGWTITGTMAGRRYLGTESPAYFARAATSIVNNSTTLLSSDEPVSLYARMEHTPSQSTPNVAKLYTGTTGDVTLLCTNQPTTVTLDGNTLAFTWTGGLLTFELPSGEHVLNCY